MCPVSPLPHYPPLLSPTTALPRAGTFTLAHDQRILSCGQARGTPGDIQCCSTPRGGPSRSEAVPPRPCRGPCCGTASVTSSAPPGLSPLLVAVGGFPELVSHHFSREVVEVEHVLEEGVLRDLVLVRRRRGEEEPTGWFPPPWLGCAWYQGDSTQSPIPNGSAKQGHCPARAWYKERLQPLPTS